jgi:hypothetical protein
MSTTPWYQFSLRSLLLTVTLAAVLVSLDSIRYEYLVDVSNTNEDAVLQLFCRCRGLGNGHWSRIEPFRSVRARWIYYK